MDEFVLHLCHSNFLPLVPTNMHTQDIFPFLISYFLLAFSLKILPPPNALFQWLAVARLLWQESMIQDFLNLLSSRIFPASFPLPFGLCLFIRQLISSPLVMWLRKAKMFGDYYSWIRFTLQGDTPKPCYYFNGRFWNHFITEKFKHKSRNYYNEWPTIYPSSSFKSYHCSQFCFIYTSTYSLPPKQWMILKQIPEIISFHLWILQYASKN